jgi:hypothetical protein
MTATAAVSPVSTPMAFSKKGANPKMEEDMSAKEVIYKDREGGIDVYWVNNKDTGGKIYLKPESIAKFLKKGYRIVQLSLEEEQKIDEMTTTGDVSGYNIPSAFSKKGGSHRGVEGSAKLGYELTGIGKQEMQRQGDPLYETKKK